MHVQEKVKQALALLQEYDIDCWITFVRESQVNGDPTLDFLLGLDVTWHSAFVLTREGKAYAIVGQYDRAAVEDLGAYDEVIGYVEGIEPSLKQRLQALAPRRIALNYSTDSEICDGLLHGMFLYLWKILRDIGMEDAIVSAESLVSALRERKSPAELQCMREAIHHTEEIFEQVRGFIEPGKTEQEIAGFMQQDMMRRGLEPAWTAAACPAVFTGPDTAEAHHAPTCRRVKGGHILSMDFGVRVDGYCSDMQRSFYILKPGETVPPRDVQRGFDTIRVAIEAARKKMKPGVTGRDVDAAARDVLAAAGYEAFPHGLGHQVGRYAHDGTALLGPEWEKYAQKPFKKLEANMVFTLEPRLTVPGKGIVTVEEMVVISEQGAEYLSHPQKELLVIQ